MHKIGFIGLALLLASPVSAQCFNRFNCDTSTFEIRTQLNVSVPLPDQSSPSDSLKAVEDAQHQLSTLSARELDAIKAIYGADASLRSATTNSNIQENGPRSVNASVSVSNTYTVKKPK